MEHKFRGEIIFTAYTSFGLQFVRCGDSVSKEKFIKSHDLIFSLQHIKHTNP